jgi:hypothetical protein
MANKCCCDGCDCEKEIRVSFCPKCNSTDVKYIFGFGNVFGVIPRQKCQKCGLEAFAFPILVTSKKLLEGSVKKKAKKKASTKAKKKVKRR